MIGPKELVQYCCHKKKSYIDFPFGKEPVCIKVKGKIFAEIYPEESNYKITLKCEPTLADFFRRQYPDIVVRGYHCPPVQQPHRNTVWVDKIDDWVLYGMIDHSYEQVVKSFSKKVQKDISME
jgi:predicted DNA-binding protein (MmcQ/YjbR family)